MRISRVPIMIFFKKKEEAFSLILFKKVEGYFVKKKDVLKIRGENWFFILLK